MKIEITIPDIVIATFKQDYREIKGVKPSKKIMREFFEQDIPNLYAVTAENDGFVDMINETEE